MQITDVREVEGKIDGGLSLTKMHLHIKPHSSVRRESQFELHAPACFASTVKEEEEQGPRRCDCSTVNLKLFTDAAIFVRSGRKTWSGAYYRQLDESAVRRVN